MHFFLQSVSHLYISQKLNRIFNVSSVYRVSDSREYSTILFFHYSIEIGTKLQLLPPLEMKDCLPFLLIRWILSITHNFGAAPPPLPYGEDAATVSWGAGKRPSCFAWPHNLPKPISGPRWTHAGRPKVTAPATLCEKLPSRFRAPHTATTSFAANGLSALIILKPQRYNRAATTTAVGGAGGRERRRGGGKKEFSLARPTWTSRRNAET